MSKRSVSTTSLKNASKEESDTEPLSDYIDGNLIERDVTLSEGGIHLRGDFKIEDKGFKLHLPMYLLKSGVEVSWF